MSEVYRAYVSGELGLREAAQRLREMAISGTWEAAVVDLDRLPAAQRAKAAALLDEVVGPTCRAYMAGTITTEAAARELAPFVLPLGVFALNFPVEPGAKGVATLARFGELLGALGELGDEGER